MDRCARCGASVGEGHRFCGNCGAPVGRCPGCGEPVIAGSLREQSTPYHLAHGLLDHAAHLLRMDQDAAVGIAERLRCLPLLDRAETIQPARPRTAAS